MHLFIASVVGLVGRTPQIVLVALFLLCLMPGRTYAIPLLYEFEGEVTSVSIGVESIFSVGQDLFVSATVDSLASDLRPDTGILGIYAMDSLAVRIDTPSGFMASVADGAFTVFNNDPSTDPDSFQINNGSTFSSPPFGSLFPNCNILGMPECGLNLDGTDSSATVFSSDGLPLTLDANDFSPKEGVLGGALWHIDFQWSRVNVSAVPIPSTLLLFGGGIAGLVAWRLRQSRVTNLS